MKMSMLLSKVSESKFYLVLAPITLFFLFYALTNSPQSETQIKSTDSIVNTTPQASFSTETDTKEIKEATFLYFEPLEQKNYTCPSLIKDDLESLSVFLKDYDKDSLNLKLNSYQICLNKCTETLVTSLEECSLDSQNESESCYITRQSQDTTCINSEKTTVTKCIEEVKSCGNEINIKYNECFSKNCIYDQYNDCTNKATLYTTCDMSKELIDTCYKGYSDSDSFCIDTAKSLTSKCLLNSENSLNTCLSKSDEILDKCTKAETKNKTTCIEKCDSNYNLTDEQNTLVEQKIKAYHDLISSECK